MDEGVKARKKQSGTWRFIKINHPLYLMLLPALLYFLIFRYVPIAGSIIAFKDYNIYTGLWKSDWVGFYWFKRFFTQPQFNRVLWNTIVINFYQLLFAFPLPIIFASLLNEIRLQAFKRTVQTIAYLPHFLSWAIIYGLAFMLLSSQTGFVNQILNILGMDAIPFLQQAEYFRSIIIISGIWKDMGWSTIIFLAAIAGISPTLYQAAMIDGAGRLKQFLHVTLPGLTPAVMILLLLQIGSIMDLSFEQIWIFLSPLTYATGDVIDTFNYRIGIIRGEYSFTTAIGLFKSIVGLIMIVIANRGSRWLTGESLY